PAHGTQALNDLVVAQPTQPREGNRPIHDLRRQVADRRRLRPRHPGAPYLRLGCLQDGLRRQVPVEHGDEAAVDRCRRSARELLVRDGSDQGTERVRLTPAPELRRPDPFDQTGHDPVALGDLRGPLLQLHWHRPKRVAATMIIVAGADLELVRHNTWANVRLLDVCTGLTDEPLDTPAQGTYRP